MKYSLETKLIHAGEPRPRIGGAITAPIFQSSTFELGDAAGYHDVRYIRLSNTPSHAPLHAKLASLEGGEAALVAASGMAAISSTLLSLVKSGEHLLAHQSLYGGSHAFLAKDLARLGIEVTFVDAGDSSSWKSALRKTTRAFYVETITNPLLQVPDLPAVARFSREHGLVSVVDNTLATPVNFRPIEHGYDLVVHSATKYLNGHSDIVAGAVVGSAERVAAVKRTLDHFGGSLDPHACFLLHRGLKTLALRVRHQNESTLALAKALESHRAVRRVHYPGLTSHPRHGQAKEWFAGSGGLLSFEVQGGVPAAEKWLSLVTLPANAPSLGGAETLVTRPVITSHASLPAAERVALGITDELIRVAVGLEGTDDLVADFRAALDAL